MATLICQVLQCQNLVLYVLSKNDLERLSGTMHRIFSWSAFVGNENTKIIEYDVATEVSLCYVFINFITLLVTDLGHSD